MTEWKKSKDCPEWMECVELDVGANHGTVYRVVSPCEEDWVAHLYCEGKPRRSLFLRDDQGGKEEAMRRVERELGVR